MPVAGVPSGVLPLTTAADVIERSNRVGRQHIESDFDPSLWVRVEGIEGVCLLGLKSNLRWGPFTVWSEHDRRGRTARKQEVIEASPSAWVWIDGYLAGCAPTFEQYYGFDSDECSADEFQRLWGRLERAQQRFRSDGHLGRFPPRPQVTIPPSAVGGSRIWLGGSETTWVWNGASWDLADQHTTSEVLKHGLVCMDDPICDASVEEVAPDVWICPHCGQLQSD